MRKTLGIIFILGMTISLGSFAFAEPFDAAQGESSNEAQGHGGPGKDKMMKMMGMRHKDSLVATEDGGVVILQGPRLLKYDKTLTLIKEVELPRPQKPGSSPEQAAASENASAGT